jgi:hypothetical protein
MMRICSVAMCVLLLVACGDKREKQASQVSPWPDDGAPSVMLALAEDIAAYTAVTGHLPNELVAIDAAGLSTAGPYADHAYAYHPAGIGILREGWRVLAADDRMREAGKVWCVVRPPAVLRSPSALRVVQVPMPELRDAAAATTTAP